MKKKILYYFLSTAILGFAIESNAQRKPDDPKHENHYTVTPVETDEIAIEFSNAHSQQEFTLVKVKVTNKTNDYIMWKAEESIFKYPDGKKFKPTGSGMFKGLTIMIPPKETANNTLKVSGAYNYHAESLTFIPKGFFRIPANGNVLEAPDFQLPASTNDFTAGDFRCSLDKLKKETKETSASFKCEYMGDQIGIIDPSKLVVKTQNGQEYANDNRKDKAKLMSPKDNEKISAEFHIPGKVTDMQFATMHIVWKNTFSESKGTPFNVGQTDFKLDPGMTAAKNE